jgi:hypothetical protein
MKLPSTSLNILVCVLLFHAPQVTITGSSNNITTTASSSSSMEDMATLRSLWEEHATARESRMRVDQALKKKMLASLPVYRPNENYIVGPQGSGKTNMAAFYKSQGLGGLNSPYQVPIIVVNEVNRDEQR